MTMFSFKEQTGQWQHAFARSQSAGGFKRLLAWLVLGVFFVIGAFLLLFVLLLSWLLIPVMLYRHRRRMQQFRQAAEAQFTTADNGAHRVIEGEVLHKEER